MSNYQVFFIRTITGEKGARIEPTALSWSIELNKTESCSLTVKAKDLAKVDPAWWYPDAGGILLTYQDPFGRNLPIVAGPIQGWPTDKGDEVSFDFAGIRDVLKSRNITRDKKYRGLSLGSIAWRIVEETMSEKPGGLLPIVHGSPDQEFTDDADHQRTYEQWNLANNNVDKRLTELSEVINGPDIMFRPEWVDETQQRIQWSMVHGTEKRPPIIQTWTPDFDLTGPNPSITDPQVTSDASMLANRVWVTGSGEGESVARQYADDLTSLSKWMPFRERVLSDSDQGNDEKLLAKARGEIAASQRIVQQVSFSTRADSKKYPLGSFHVGDTGMVNISGFLTFPSGRWPMRLLKLSGNLDEKVNLEFQEDAWE